MNIMNDATEMMFYGGAFLSSFNHYKKLIPPAALFVLSVLVLMALPDEIVRIIVGGIAVFYAYLLLPPLEATLVLGVYLIGIFYLHNYAVQYFKREQARV